MQYGGAGQAGQGDGYEREDGEAGAQIYKNRLGKSVKHQFFLLEVGCHTLWGAGAQHEYAWVVKPPPLVPRQAPNLTGFSGRQQTLTM